MTRSLTRPAAWHKNRRNCSLRRLTAEEFEAYDFVMNAEIPADRLPAVEAFEVRDDEIGEVVGVVWSAACPQHQHWSTHRFFWQFVDRRMDVYVTPPKSLFMSLHSYAWWQRQDVVYWLLAAERGHRSELKQSSAGAEALADFYV